MADIVEKLAGFEKRMIELDTKGKKRDMAAFVTAGSAVGTIATSVLTLLKLLTLKTTVDS